MRQPLKPFSVEVRHSARRKPVPTASQPRDLLTSLGPSKDDAYDAALKAADALFGQSAAMEQHAADAASVAIEESDPTTPISAQPSSPRPPGRILQAIEAAPDPVMALEAEKAPAARRGRPPGSKNKVQRPAAASKRGAKDGRLEVVPKAADALITALFGRSDEADPPPVVSRAPILLPDDGERLRFSWIRKELQPGERWKRRMSRVCW